MSRERDRLLSVFAEQREALLRFLALRLGDAALAQDLAQETWLRAARLDGTIAIDNPRSYLFRIAANLALDHLRRQGRSMELRVEEDVAAAVPDPAPSPEAVALHRSEYDRLLAVIAGLSPRCREVFVLAKFEGLTYAEVATRLGIARTTVVTHMITAFAALERAMDREKNAPGGSTGPRPGAS